MSALGIIPIRYHSTRLNNKTFRMVAGKLLIDWTMEAVEGSQLDHYVVLTSCKVVQRYCKDKHIDYLVRPIGLESDIASVIDSVCWLNDNPLYNYHTIQMLLQITNPTRTWEDIDKCLDLINIESVNSICSVVDVGEYHPNRMYIPMLGNGLKPLTESAQWLSTQRLPKLFLRDGSIYCWKMKAFIKQRCASLLPDRIMSYEIERERSIRIDVWEDLELAEKYLTRVRESVY
jgi:CMP-N-acetylneuraminic acid synthetase